MLNTEWVTYLNSDDVVYGDAYARLIMLGNEEKADVVYGHYDYVDYFGRFLYSFFPFRRICLAHYSGAANVALRNQARSFAEMHFVHWAALMKPIA